MEYIEWDEEKLKEYLEDKEKERGIDIKELLLLSKFIREHKFKVMYDLGTFLGVSGYIIGTSSPHTETLISSDIAEHEIKLGWEHKWDYQTYGMYLPKDAIFERGDFRLLMDNHLKKHKPEFVFLDDGHTPRAIWDQFNICYKNKVRYIAIHDSGKIVKKVRRSMKAIISKNMYKILFEDIESCPEKGITFLEIVNET